MTRDDEALWVGLISGTSADGVDAALVRVGPTTRDVELIEYCEQPLGEELRERIHRVVEEPLPLRDLVRLDVQLGECFAAAALAVMAAAGRKPAQVEGIASHGQTIGHFPAADVRGTLQLGSPSLIHERTGVPVVSDFRSADIAAGGQGAPLTPFLHHALFAAPGEARAVLNIGGFTNLTFLAGTDADAVIAFDPGPGNALIDRAARAASAGAERFDRDGERARRGRVVDSALLECLAHPYFELPPPKSTGHEQFGADFYERAARRVSEQGGTSDDLIATLTELTVRSVAIAVERFVPKPAATFTVYGGGVHNRALMDRLASLLAPARVERSDALGIASDALEAVTFALLGYCAARGLVSNLPAATGASRAVSLGSATPPAAFRS